jgi:quercetin dioxygenase-like cupin family protein
MPPTTHSQTHDPIHRVSMSFEREGDDRLWVDTWLDDGGYLPEHFHPTLEERWRALDGAVRVKIGGAWRDLRPEDGVVVVARGIRHELRNTSGRQAHLRAEVIPPGRLEQFLTESARAARERLFSSRNLPTGLRGASWVSEFALRFSDETVMCSPPPALQRLLLPPLARATRRYRPWA